MQMNSNTPPEKRQQWGLSWKQMKKVTIEQMLCTYTPDFTVDPTLARIAADQASTTLIPIPTVVLVGVN